jgi:hypothetical protein
MEALEIGQCGQSRNMQRSSLSSTGRREQLTKCELQRFQYPISKNYPLTGNTHSRILQYRLKWLYCFSFKPSTGSHLVATNSAKLIQEIFVNGHNRLLCMKGHCDGSSYMDCIANKHRTCGGKRHLCGLLPPPYRWEEVDNEPLSRLKSVVS